MGQPLTTLDLPVPKLRSGKVREVFDLGATLLFVVTDRLSAFDCILPDPIPDKGAVLNQIDAARPVIARGKSLQRPRPGIAKRLYA